MTTEAQRRAELAAMEEFIRTHGVRRLPNSRVIAGSDDIPFWLTYDRKKRKFTRAPLPDGRRNWAWGG